MTLHHLLILYQLGCLLGLDNMILYLLTWKYLRTVPSFPQFRLWIISPWQLSFAVGQKSAIFRFCFEYLSQRKFVVPSCWRFRRVMNIHITQETIWFCISIPLYVKPRRPISLHHGRFTILSCTLKFLEKLLQYFIVFRLKLKLGE